LACGKFVLAKNLLSERELNFYSSAVLHFSGSDSPSLEAICASLLLQLLKMEPGLVRLAVEQYRKFGKEFTSSLDLLMETSSSAVGNCRRNHIIIVLDVHLPEAIGEVFFRSLVSPKSSKLGILLFSRPITQTTYLQHLPGVTFDYIEWTSTFLKSVIRDFAIASLSKWHEGLPYSDGDDKPPLEDKEI
jgi:hypothetical protein